MEKYVSVVGLKHCHGLEPCRVGRKVTLRKDVDNAYDDEAIMVEMMGIGKIGYVANSTQTVARGTYSAGRLYDTFAEMCQGEIRFIVGETVIVQIDQV